ncbi:MAG: SRPBCC family protein [Bacteroidia bacterium]|nr:SRPBCC family protein [Bacteroidia bacterium]
MKTKNLISVALMMAFSLFGISGKAFAQPTKDALITTSALANVSADKVWEQIRKMDNIPQLSSAVGSLSWKGPKGVGGERKCVTPDKSGYFIEKILEFDDENRTYEWQVVEGVPAKNVINRFRIIDLGYNKSMVVFTSRFEFIENPNMSEDQFRGFLQSASYEMASNAIKLSN